MKVKLKEVCFDSSLKNDKEYTVACIEIYEDDSYYRIYSERNSPSLFQADHFEITSNKIPSEWKIFYSNEKKFFDFSPESWMKDDFWEKYFDAEPEAIEEFHRVLKIIESES